MALVYLYNKIRIVVVDLSSIHIWHAKTHKHTRTHIYICIYIYVRPAERICQPTRRAHPTATLQNSPLLIIYDAMTRGGSLYIQYHRQRECHAVCVYIYLLMAVCAQSFFSLWTPSNPSLFLAISYSHTRPPQIHADEIPWVTF